MSTARRLWSHPSHYMVHPPTPTMVTHIGHSHGHEWSTHIPFVPCQSAPIPQIRLFQTLTLNDKVKIMGKVKGQGHIVHPVSNRCTSFLFHINRTNHSWDMSNRVFDLEKTHPKFSKKIWQKRISNKIPLKSNQVISMTRQILVPSFVVIGLVVITLSCRQAYCFNQCHTRDLGSRSPIGHPVHFPRPILSLSQISNMKLKRFWREKQKSFAADELKT